MTVLCIMISGAVVGLVYTGCSAKSIDYTYIDVYYNECKQ